MTREKEFVIYTLSHPITKEVRYVGWTSRGIETRLMEHIQESRTTKKTHKLHWIRLLKRGGLVPEIDVLEIITKGNYAKRERYWISYFGRENLVNGTDGGDGCRGWSPSDETRVKMSLSHNGLSHSSETRNKISCSAKGNTNALGATRSAETRSKISEAHKGRAVTLKTGNRISDANMGRKNCSGTSSYVGVCLDKGRKKWRAGISINKKQSRLGSFQNEIIAAQNYDLASMTHHDGKYPINFPDLKPKYKKLIKQGITKITEEIK